MLGELPDELENIIGNMTPQPNTTAQSGLETIQKHQQLSHLLATSAPGQTSVSVQNPMQRNVPVSASANLMGNMGNSMGQNSRSSLPNQHVQQNKGMMPNASVSHNLQGDRTVTSGYSNMAVNIPGPNTLTCPTGGPNVNQGAMNQGHITNGPMNQSRNVAGPGGNALNNFQNLPQTNTVGRNNISNNMGMQSVGQNQVAGQHNATGSTGLSQITSMSPATTRVSVLMFSMFKSCSLPKNLYGSLLSACFINSMQYLIFLL